MPTKWLLKDLTGQVFTRLTVLSRHPVNHSHGNAQWVVRCVCGVEKVVRSCHLINGHTTSCGCYNRENQQNRSAASRSRTKFVEHMFTRYRRGARVRDVLWQLTPEEFDCLLQGKCFYCGIEPKSQNRQRGNAGHFLYNGIDRLVNHLGYFPENCVSCCGTCNIAKQDMSIHAFMTWASRLTENLQDAN